MFRHAREPSIRDEITTVIRGWRQPQESVSRQIAQPRRGDTTPFASMCRSFAASIPLGAIFLGLAPQATFCRRFATGILCVLFAASTASAQVDLPNAKPIPMFQVLPHADDETAIERGERELTRYHFGKDLRRPFLYPIVGPSGRSLTRMGHPHDPHTHSHHNSVWVSHHKLNGVDFWGDYGKDLGTIATKRPVRYDDSDDEALLEFEHAWKNAQGETLLDEVRTIRVRPRGKQDYLVILDLKLSAPAGKPATFDKTPFGLVGVRMAKSIGVHDGGGTIRNSAGGRDEQEVLWKQAKWVDYSGPIRPNVQEGITLIDHPQNPNHPTYFHVRGDGWMGASLTFDAPRTIEPGSPLHLRYGLWVHAGVPEAETIESVFQEFAKTEPPPPKKK